VERQNGGKKMRKKSEEKMKEMKGEKTLKNRAIKRRQ
jgi:hypothetical protein